MTERQMEIVFAAMADKISALELDLMLIKYENEQLKAQLEAKKNN